MEHYWYKIWLRMEYYLNLYEKIGSREAFNLARRDVDFNLFDIQGQ